MAATREEFIVVSSPLFSRSGASHPNPNAAFQRGEVDFGNVAVQVAVELLAKALARGEHRESRSISDATKHCHTGFITSLFDITHVGAQTLPRDILN